MAILNLRAIVLPLGILALVFSPRVFPQESSAAESGRDRYAGFGCAACHGAQGEGTALGPGLAMGAFSLADFIGYLRQPTGTMPAYPADAISDEALGDMYAYLQPLGPPPRPEGRVEVGAELYSDTGCYQCHANEGQGGAQGPRLGPDPITFARFSWYVRQPSGSMPPYTDTVMTDQDLADVHAFLEARPRPPAVSSIPLLSP